MAAHVNGEDLGKVLAAARVTGTPLDLDCALTIVAGACVVVHQAHEAMRAGAGTYGELSAQRIRVGFDGQVQLVPGMPDATYKAPETGRPDRRADVFALGVMLYEATTGQRPFDKAGQEAARPSLTVPGYPPALETVVLRALAKEPGRRPPTVQELQRQIEGYAREHRRKLSPAAVAQRMAGLFPGRRVEPDNVPSYVPHSLPQFDESDIADPGETSHDLPAQERTGQRNVESPHHKLPTTLKMDIGPASAPIPPVRTPASSSPPLTHGIAPPMIKAPKASQPGISKPVSTLPGIQVSGVLAFDEPTAQVRSLAEIERSPGSSLAETSAWAPALEPPTAASMLPLAPPPHSVELAIGTEPPDGRLAASRAQVSSAKCEAADKSRPSAPSRASAPSLPPAPTPPRPSAPASAPTPPTSSSPSPSSSPPSSPPAPVFSPPAPPAFGPAAVGSRNSSSMPVPGNPGAVPIVQPPMMSMVPSGGTLVSSATIAGNAHISAHGPSSLSGELVGRAGASMQNFASHGYSPSPPVGYPNQGFPSTLPGVGVAPGYAADPLEPPPGMVPASSAAPQALVLQRRRSPLPLIVTAVVGIAGAFAGIWFGVLRNTDEPAAATEPAAAPVSNKRHTETPDPPAAAPVESAPAGSAAAPAPVPRVAAQPEPAPAPPAQPEPAAPPVAALPEPARPADSPAPTVPDKAPTPDKAPAPDKAPTPDKAQALIDPAPPPEPKHAATAATKPRPPTKPIPKPHRKTESKEQSWSDDSPFMPVATPKR